jgi:hypothetical protein
MLRPNSRAFKGDANGLKDLQKLELGFPSVYLSHDSKPA